MWEKCGGKLCLSRWVDELVSRSRADKRLIGGGRDCTRDPAAGGGSASRAFSGLAKKRRNERLEVCRLQIAGRLAAGLWDEWPWGQLTWEKICRSCCKLSYCWGFFWWRTVAPRMGLWWAVMQFCSVSCMATLIELFHIFLIDTFTEPNFPVNLKWKRITLCSSLRVQFVRHEQWAEWTRQDRSWCRRGWRRAASTTATRSASPSRSSSSSSLRCRSTKSPPLRPILSDIYFRSLAFPSVPWYLSLQFQVNVKSPEADEKFPVDLTIRQFR